MKIGLLTEGKLPFTAANLTVRRGGYEDFLRK
jgi:hypothetical protein